MSTTCRTAATEFNSVIFSFCFWIEYTYRNAFLYFWSAPQRIPSIFLKALRVIIQRATNEALLVVVKVLLWKFEMTDWFHGNPYLITDSSGESHWTHLSSFKTSTYMGSTRANRTWRSLPWYIYNGFILSHLYLKHKKDIDRMHIKPCKKREKFKADF